MEKDFTEPQKRIKRLAEASNPYAAECPNRHLWEEGYFEGYEYAVKKYSLIDTVKTSVDKDRIALIKQNFIQFVQYYVNLSPPERCTVHPPNGESMKGLYELPIEEILEKWMERYNVIKNIF